MIIRDREFDVIMKARRRTGTVAVVQVLVCCHELPFAPAEVGEIGMGQDRRAFGKFHPARGETLHDPTHRSRKKRLVYCMLRFLRCHSGPETRVAPEKKTPLPCLSHFQVSMNRGSLQFLRFVAFVMSLAMSLDNSSRVGPRSRSVPRH